MTFRLFHHKNGTLKSDRLNACFQILEPNIGSLKTDRVNGPEDLSIFFLDIVSRIMWFCKLYVHQVIVCKRNPRCYGIWKAKLDTIYSHQNGQTPTQSSSGFLVSNRLNSLMVLLIDRFSISLLLTILLCFDVHLLYTPIYCFHLLISKTLCARFQQRELTGYPFGISTRAIFKEHWK